MLFLCASAILKLKELKKLFVDAHIMKQATNISSGENNCLSFFTGPNDEIIF